MISGAETSLKNNKKSLNQFKSRNNKSNRSNRISSNKRNQRMISGVGIDK